ncbi:Hypothetical protein MYA_1855 [Burkholderia sp. KJ006]|nr:Hypothetical protein MYA_1855 [Burkholderia sp. KJ006]
MYAIVGTGAQQTRAEQDRSPDRQAQKGELMHVNRPWVGRALHREQTRRRNEIKSTDRFRGSTMLAKCKAESEQRLMPLKRYRVNQHKAINYFLQRNRT